MPWTTKNMEGLWRYLVLLSTAHRGYVTSIWGIICWILFWQCSSRSIAGLSCSLCWPEAIPKLRAQSPPLNQADIFTCADPVFRFSLFFGQLLVSILSLWDRVDRVDVCWCMLMYVDVHGFSRILHSSAFFRQVLVLNAQLGDRSWRRWRGSVVGHWENESLAWHVFWNGLGI